MNSFFKTSNGYAFTFLRIFLGIAAIWHSFPVLFMGGLVGFTGFVESLGLPYAPVMAFLAKCFEFIGGLMVLLGFFSRVGATMIATTLLIAVWIAHDFKIFSEAAMAFDLLVMSITIILGGSGKLSLREWPKNTDQL